jgi:hypothetical protein
LPLIGRLTIEVHGGRIDARLALIIGLVFKRCTAARLSYVNQVAQISRTRTMNHQANTAFTDLNIFLEFDALEPVRIGLSEQTRAHGVQALNRLLAHTTVIRDAYKKAHWHQRMEK